ncbi:hypothetical protein HMPREF9072_01852, partial [Capnocytophaga sp. oral taxon 324 str. F0483]
MFLRLFFVVSSSFLRSLFVIASLHSTFSVILPPIAYDLRPIAYFSFFRLETPFLPFFDLLYYSINQLLTYPFYTNRPR